MDGMIGKNFVQKYLNSWLYTTAFSDRGNRVGLIFLEHRGLAVLNHKIKGLCKITDTSSLENFQQQQNKK